MDAACAGEVADAGGALVGSHVGRGLTPGSRPAIVTAVRVLARRFVEEVRAEAQQRQAAVVPVPTVPSNDPAQGKIRPEPVAVRAVSGLRRESRSHVRIEGGMKTVIDARLGLKGVRLTGD